MGFDNECILSIQSLPGEYFCPVCRTLIYPNEALQAQCTHVYCKPCLAYVVATTKACPYDGYLVTETDSMPLVESNKSLAETIGNVTVHCLYNKSGCQWQGTLSTSITHGATCAYGNSPVVCNRCGTQIVHRQVQEHAILCPGVQSQTQQADGSQAQLLAATTQAVTRDPSLVPSAGPAAAPTTTVPSATAATAVTSSSVATGGSAATTASAAVAASAPQTSTAEQWYQQQLRYSQYYQQQYPGYNHYTQQYQQYGQYQQAYQQYTQPQLQVAPQNVAQASAQLPSYVQPQVLQSSQPQHMMQSQPPNQHQLQAPTGHPQTQQHTVQPHPQSQPHIPHLQAPAGQPQPQQPTQSAPQVPRLQPPVHKPAPTQVGNQQFAIPSSQTIPQQVQPHVQAQPPQQQIVAQQQHAQPQALPPQQNLHPPQVQQQSYQYPQSQAYAQPMLHVHPQNTSYPQQQMAHSAPLQQPVHVSQQQGLVSQHPVPMRPPLPGQQPPLGIQHTPQHQQQIGYHAQRMPMHSSIPSQAPPQGLTPHSSVSLQASQSYQQGMPPSQQQVHPQPSQSHGTPYGQQHIHGYAGAGHHVQTSSGSPMNHAAPPQQFQHQPSGPVNNLQASIINQQPTGQGSLALETHARKSARPENASNAADNTAVSENKMGCAESSVMKPTMSQSLCDANMNGEHNNFGSGRKDSVQTESSIGNEIAGRAGNSHGPGLHGGKEHKASDAYDNFEKGGSVQKASQKNSGTRGSYVPPGMGQKHPFGPDRMLPHHMIHPGPMPYNMQGQRNQMRPPKHSFSENILPPMQQPYDSFHSKTAPRAFGENQIQSPMPHPAGIRPGDGMIQQPMAGPFSGQHDTVVPPFVPEHLGRPHPLGMSKSNGVDGGPFVSGMAFNEEGFSASGEHLRSFPAYAGRHNVNHKDIEDGLKQFPGPAHLDGQGLQMGPSHFQRALGRPDGFPDRPAIPNQKGSFPVGLHEDFSRKHNATAGRPDFLSPGAEFDHHMAGRMPNLRNPGPFFQGMSGRPGGLHKDHIAFVNVPGNVQHAFDGPEFPHTRFHPGHMHPDGPNFVAEYSRHEFAKEPGHFDLGGLMRNGDVGWCRICLFNCGSAENLDLHVQTREHQQFAMDIVLKMKQDVAKRRKLNYGGPKSFHNKKVAGKGHFRGNRR